MSEACLASRVPALDQRQEDLVDDLGEDGVRHGGDSVCHVLVAEQCRRHGGDLGVQRLRRGLAAGHRPAEERKPRRLVGTAALSRAAQFGEEFRSG
jgi:hypothetical protein